MQQRTIGAYVVLEKLGSGGMGEVYLAEDRRLRRKVAIKSLINEEGTNRNLIRKRLLHEARLAASLNHPNIATIYDIVESDKQSHIVMEFVDGQNLADHLKSVPIPFDGILDIAIQLVEAVGEAHAHGIIHRDLKPQNIYITTGGRVKVLDFGLATALERSKPVNLASTSTSVGAGVAGTPLYMSPEQLVQSSLDVRTDIYSIGVVIFQMITGRLPYHADDLLGLISAVLTGPLPSVREFAPEVPEDMDRVLQRCIARQPQDRYPSAKELGNDLLQLKGTASTGRPSVSSPRKLDEPSPGSMPLEYQQAQSLMQRGDVPGNLDAAMDLLSKCVQKNPRFAQAHAAIGEAYVMQFRITGETSLAVRALESTLEALRLEPSQASVRLSLARIHALTGRTAEAVEEFRKVIEERPEDVDAHRSLGEVLMRAGQIDQALMEFQTAVQLNPRDSVTFRIMGLSCYRSARYQEAIACFIRVTEFQPDNAWAFQMLGTTYHALGRLGHALANYHKANELSPMASAYSNIGTIHYSAGRYEDAIQAYEKAIELKPSSPIHYRNLGDTFQKIGEPGKAQELYKRAIERSRDILKINPNDAITLSQLAVYEAKIGNLRQAAQHIRAARSTSPEDAEVLYRELVVSALGGNIDSASNTLKLLLERGYSRDVMAKDDDLNLIRSLPIFNEVFKGS